MKKDNNERIFNLVVLKVFDGANGYYKAGDKFTETSRERADGLISRGFAKEVIEGKGSKGS